MSSAGYSGQGEFKYHIIGADGREYGPVPFNDLDAWVTQGKVNALTQVRRDHEPNWQPASAIPELQSIPSLTAGPPQITAGIPQQPMDPAKAANAKKLVMISRIVGYTGMALLIFGPIVGLAMGNDWFASVTAIGGLVIAVTGGIVGQVGRGMQGRAI